jgi:hypothetical protein
VSRNTAFIGKINRENFNDDGIMRHTMLICQMLLIMFISMTVAFEAFSRLLQSLMPFRLLRGSFSKCRRPKDRGYSFLNQMVVTARSVQVSAWQVVETEDWLAAHQIADFT